MDEFKYPGTAEERRAGMAAFRARMLKVHQQELANDKTPEEKAFRQELIDTILSAQRKFGEV